MSGVIKGALAAVLLAGSTVAATAPAEADRGTGALIAGIAGLAVGAAIASDHPHRYYAEPARYYAPPPPPPPPVAYSGYGYAPGYGYAYPDGYRGDHRGGYGWDRDRSYGGEERGWGDGYRR